MITMETLVQEYLEKFTFRDAPKGAPIVASMDPETLRNIILDCLGYVNQRMDEEVLKTVESPSKHLH